MLTTSLPRRRGGKSAIAAKLSLRGFLLTGKPGYIGVQGNSEDVALFLASIKRMTWQSITVRWSEDRVCACATKTSTSSHLECCYEKFEVIGSPPGHKSNLLDLIEAVRIPRDLTNSNCKPDKRKLVETITGYPIKNKDALP